MATKTAEQFHTEAQDYRHRAAESFERCDTDGFLSQWALETCARECELNAKIAENGGMWEFPALFDLDGNLVAAKRIETRYGMSWGLMADDSGRGRFLGWFNPSEARNGERRRAADERKGYRLGTVRVPAKAETYGSSMIHVSVRAARTDGGFSRDAVIVDDGTGADAYPDWR